MRSVIIVAVVAMGLSCAADVLDHGDRVDLPAVRLLPSSIELHGRRSHQAIMLVKSGWSAASDEAGPLLDRDDVSFRSTNPEVARIDDGLVRPEADGVASIEAVLGGRVIAATEVRVSGTGERAHWSFRHDVQSVLARQGCNMGACHGALAGKGGFRLSLRGYDSDADFVTITREARGRRVEMADPGRSLLLAKPTGALPHQGGLRLDPNSRDYRVIAEWIAAGARGPSDDDPQLTHLTVTPARSRLELGDRSRVLVTAHYDNQGSMDVTHWAKFTATDESVAGVDEDGCVTVRGSGESAVLVWFGSQVKLARMTVPYPNKVDDDRYASARKRNFIDDLNLQQLKTLRLPPSPRATDEAFLRRATLDTVGRLPTIQEQDDFSDALSKTSDSRAVRDDVIDRLLASDAFVDYWTYRFSDLLLINGTRLRPAAVKAYYAWLRESIADGKPWDATVREILTSTGGTTENGATNFFALHQSPEDMTENACQAFLGLSIGCAKCHNHPLEKWTNDQYYAMANLFARVRAKGWGGETRNGDGMRTLYVVDSGDLIQPSKGEPQPPAPLDATPLALDDPSDRRVPLANWMTNPENPYFARSITNRVWANFFGRGLVDPVDDLRLSNPASNEALLDATSQHLISVNFDLRRLMRTILQSETYQRSSRPMPGNVNEDKYLSRYYPRRMMAEVMLDAIDQTMQTHTKFDQVAFSGADRQKTDFYPSGTRALELYDSAIESYFLKTFGRNPREITCDCERSDEPSMVQVLHMSNGSTINEKLESDSNVVATCLRDGDDDATIIGRLFRRALARDPEPSELDVLLETLATYEDRVVGLRDVAWSILTSTEFTFNH